MHIIHTFVLFWKVPGPHPDQLVVPNVPVLVHGCSCFICYGGSVYSGGSKQPAVPIDRTLTAQAVLPQRWCLLTLGHCPPRSINQLWITFLIWSGLSCPASLNSCWLVPRGCWGARRSRPVLPTMKLEREGWQHQNILKTGSLQLEDSDVYFCACRRSTIARQTNRTQIGVYIAKTHISLCVWNALQVNKNTRPTCRITFNPQNRLLHFANKC